MEVCTIKTKDEGDLVFSCPTDGGYVRLHGQDGLSGTRIQIADGGGFSGSTLTANADTLRDVARRWLRQRRAAARRG